MASRRATTIFATRACGRSGDALILLARPSTRIYADKILSTGGRGTTAQLERPFGLPTKEASSPFSSSSSLRSPPTSSTSTLASSSSSSALERILSPSPPLRFSSTSPSVCSSELLSSRVGEGGGGRAEEQRRGHSPPPPPPSFSVDAAAASPALRSKPTSDLLRSYLVLSACRVRPLVQHSEALLRISRAFPPLRDLVVDPLVRKTFFAQFCGGESEEELGPCVARLRGQGIGAILDFAAEPDESLSSSSTSFSSSSSAPTSSSLSPSSSSPGEAAVAAAAAPPPLAVARTHEYGDESLCDSNAGHVLRAIEAAAAAAASAAEVSSPSSAAGAAFAAAAAAAAPPPSCSSNSSSSSSRTTSTATSTNTLPSGYAAVKLTALTDPRVLVKLSACLREIEKLFEKFDADADGRVSRKEFEAVYRETFTDGDDPGRLDELWRYLSRSRSKSGSEKRGREGSGSGSGNDEEGQYIDRTTWVSRIKLRDVPFIVPRCRTLGPLAAAAPTLEELERLDDLMGRLRGLAAAAKERNERLLVDAEYTAVQPAIDAAALEIMKEFNSSGSGTSSSNNTKSETSLGLNPVPTVYNTTQCYLRGAEAKLRGEIDLAEKEGFAWGGKLVRGAYIDSENKRSLAANKPSPCWPSIEETHECYDECARIAMEEGVFAGKGEVLLATHNKTSVAKAVDLLSILEKEDPGDASSRVSFGQLFGMSESLTLAIARAGRRAYVYLPYGPLGEVLPYLLRRALENSQMLSGGGGGGEKGKPTELDAVRRELKARAVGVFLPRDK